VIFNFCFFHESVSPSEYTISAVSNFFVNQWPQFGQCTGGKFSAGVIDIGVNFANFATRTAGVTYVGGKFATRVNYTAGKFAASVDHTGSK
jgi:hypothetical protein